MKKHRDDARKEDGELMAPEGEARVKAFSSRHRRKQKSS